jgi:hypothetical protein
LKLFGPDRAQAVVPGRRDGAVTQLNHPFGKQFRIPLLCLPRLKILVVRRAGKE